MLLVATGRTKAWTGVHVREGTVADGERRHWAYNGGLDGLTVEYVERDLGGAVAAILLLDGDRISIQFDPKLVRSPGGYLLRFWARRHVVAGWQFALVTAADVLALSNSQGE